MFQHSSIMANPEIFNLDPQSFPILCPSAAAANGRILQGWVQEPPLVLLTFDYSFPGYQGGAPKPLGKEPFAQSRCVGKKEKNHPLASPLKLADFQPGVERYHRRNGHEGWLGSAHEAFAARAASTVQGSDFLSLLFSFAFSLAQPASGEERVWYEKESRGLDHGQSSGGSPPTARRR